MKVKATKIKCRVMEEGKQRIRSYKGGVFPEFSKVPGCTRSFTGAQSHYRNNVGFGRVGKMGSLNSLMKDT